MSETCFRCQAELDEGSVTICSTCKACMCGLCEDRNFLLEWIAANGTHSEECATNFGIETCSCGLDRAKAMECIYQPPQE